MMTRRHLYLLLPFNLDDLAFMRLNRHARCMQFGVPNILVWYLCINDACPITMSDHLKLCQDILGSQLLHLSSIPIQESLFGVPTLASQDIAQSQLSPNLTAAVSKDIQ